MAATAAPAAAAVVAPAPARSSYHRHASTRSSIHSHASHASHASLFSQPAPPRHTLAPPAALARPAPAVQRHHSDESGHDSSDVDQKSRVWAHDSSDTDVYHSTYSDEDADEPAVDSSRRVSQALLHLSLSAPFLSMAITLYTVAVLLYNILVSPLRLFIRSRPTLRFSTASALAGPLRLQLRCVNASTMQAVVYDEKHSRSWPAHSHGTLPQKSDLADRLGSLVLTHLLAPLMAIPIAFAAWIVAIFWALSAIINDEGSSGGDGKSFAITVIDWWRWYLEGRMFR